MLPRTRLVGEVVGKIRKQHSDHCSSSDAFVPTLHQEIVEGLELLALFTPLMKHSMVKAVVEERRPKRHVTKMNSLPFYYFGSVFLSVISDISYKPRKSLHKHYG